jgi:hypothetical protein
MLAARDRAGHDLRQRIRMQVKNGYRTFCARP